jgi:hypothetical protein
MENVYQLELPPEALKLIYKSVDLHHKHTSAFLKRRSSRTHDATPWNGGVVLRSISMPTVELQARVKEQQAAVKQAKLKYRGVTYIKSGK